MCAWRKIKKCRIRKKIKLWSKAERKRRRKRILSVFSYIKVSHRVGVRQGYKETSPPLFFVFFFDEGPDKKKV